MRTAYTFKRPNLPDVVGVIQSDRIFKVEDTFQLKGIFTDEGFKEMVDDEVLVIEARHVVDVVGRSTMDEMRIVLVRLPVYDVAKTTEKLNDELHAALKKAEDALDAIAIATMSNGANISHTILRVAEELRGLGYDLHATTHGIKSPRKSKP